ncbi:hypothetical protein [Pseudoalteromonas sp. B530]|uniref:hypothetical protein n=1 Tax=Pseudoalteromonas sp. B530 TaxID=2994390 RepID=UPI00224A502A|nr:hypothetical protein [Pseudoalteromonas sp. B530]MCX2765417.1 hypothetical protein [Pseudoalteromonas sp. B530]
MKKSEDRIHASSWHNLGYISKERGFFLPDTEIDENLPNAVKGVSLSFHRILPSMSCIIFEFYLNDLVSEELRRIQNKDYIGPVIFKQFWPIKHLSRGYSMGTGNQCAIEAISDYKDTVRELLERWIQKGFGWEPRTIDAVSYIDVFEIKGNPKDIDERKKWILENSTWLNEYGISTRGFDAYEGENLLLSRAISNDQKYMLSDSIAKLDSCTESELGDLIEYKVRAVAISSTIFSVIEKYGRKVETLRAHGFKNLYKRKKLTKKSQSNIQELKRTIAILSRLQHELSGSKVWIAHSISEIGELKNLARDESYNLAKNTILNSKFQLNKVKEAADIIDSGLTNYLSVQSIYVMYKLQKWMFILSIVVTIATIVGVLSGWDNLKSLLPDEVA